MALTVGVDGGATRVRAIAVGRSPHGRLTPFGSTATRVWPDAGAFEPIALDEQRAQHARDRIELTPLEREAARARVECAAVAILMIAGLHAKRRSAGESERYGPIRLGLCLAGLKTADGRGVAVQRHGPRMPWFLDELEAALAAHGVDLAAPIPALGSDGVCGAIGEVHAARGALADAGDALYLAGGTGLAEAVLLGGRVRALADLELEPAWSARFAPDLTFEDALAAGGWMRAFARAGGEGTPEDAALRGDERAIAILARAALALAQLCALRRAALGERAKLERVVFGQRLGAAFARKDLAEFLREPALAALADQGFPAEFVRVAAEPDAPALGAAALALETPN